MKVLLLVPLYPPVRGGAELQAQRLARDLAGLGMGVTVLTRPQDGQEPFDTDGAVRIVRGLHGLPVGPLWGWTYMHSARRWLLRLAAEWDVVHSQQVDLHSAVAVKVAARLGKPSLLRFACAGPGGDLARLSARRFGRRLLGVVRRADRFVALTGEGAAEIERYKFAPERISTIPNGVDLDSFRPQAWPSLSADEPLRLLFVGRLTRQKGVDVLLTALSRLRQELPFRLRIVGTGEEDGRLRAQATQVGIESVVEFAGSRSDIIREYSGCELLVLPSRFEGMPNVVLEAMACARPVLSTTIGGSADLVTDGSDGWLVRVDDPDALAQAIVRVGTLRAQLAEYGLRARRTVESRYASSRVASMYVREYEQLVSGAKREHGG